MIDIISEVRNHPDNKSNPDLKDLNMRIGIHTGKIVAVDQNNQEIVHGCDGKGIEY